MSYDAWKSTDPADAYYAEPSLEELRGLYGDEALELAGMDQMPPVVEELGTAAADTSVRTGAGGALKAYGRLEAEIILFRSLLEEVRLHLTHTGNPNGLAERIAVALEL